MASIIKANQLQDFGGNSILTSDGAGTVTVNAAQMKATPAFEAYLSSDYAPGGSIGDDTDTKVPNDTEVFDTDNAYDNSTNYRFTPQVAGKYFVYASVHNKSDTNSSQLSSLINIYKNGSVYKKTFINFTSNYIRMANIDTSAVIDMNGSSDYIEIYGRIDTAVSSNRSFGSGEKRTYFGAYRIIT